MMTIPVLGIPYYNRPDLLRRCIASIDYPVDRLVVIDNSNGGWGKAEIGKAESRNQIGWPMARSYQSIAHPNAGVAGSWNEIVKLFPAPWWMISNNDIAFGAGDLERMARAAWKACGKSEIRNPKSEAEGETGGAMAVAPEEGAPGILYGHAASWFAVTALGIATVGLWDENFYPAYLEDCDWSVRADRLGVLRVNVPDCHAIHGDERLSGSCTVNSDPVARAANVRTHGRNFVYYQRKWGGINGAETFEHPFNDPRWPISHWQFDPGMRKEQQW